MNTGDQISNQKFSLFQMNILKKQDKCDADLKELHLKMVTKKDIKPKMQPIGKKSKAVATKDVEDSLTSMNF